MMSQLYLTCNKFVRFDMTTSVVTAATGNNLPQPDPTAHVSSRPDVRLCERAEKDRLIAIAVPVVDEIDRAVRRFLPVRI